MARPAVLTHRPDLGNTDSDTGVDDLIDGAAAGGWLAQVGTGVRGLFTEAVARVDDVLSLSSEGRYELWKPNEAESDQRQLVERLDRAWERQVGTP